MFRILFGCLCFIFGVYRIYEGQQDPNGLPNTYKLLQGGAALVAAGILFSKYVTKMLSYPLLAFFDKAFAGTDFYQKPPKELYALAQKKIAEKKHEEALKIYENLIENFPKDKQPYILAIHLCCKELNNRAKAKEIFENGEDLFESKERMKLSQLVR